jgi:hypothetical protein
MIMCEASSLYEQQMAAEHNANQKDLGQTSGKDRLQSLHRPIYHGSTYHLSTLC